MLKVTKIFIFSSFIAVGSLHASLFGDIFSSGTANGTTGGAVKDTIGGVINNGKSGTVIDALGKGSFSFGDLGKLAGDLGIKDLFSADALDKLSTLGKGANKYYDICYDFSPPSITNPVGILNPCDLGDFSTTPCDLAPDLSAIGLRKKSGEDLRAYCDAMGDKPTTTTGGGTVPIGTPSTGKPITENMKKTNTSQVMKNRVEKVKASRSGGGGGSGGSSGGKKSTSVMASGGGKKVDNSSISISNTKDNQEVQKVYYQNNYKAFKLLDDVNSISTETVEPIDLSTFSNGYATLDDYRKATEDLTQIFYMNENNINLTYFKNTVDLLFAQILTSTADVTEQEQQKEAEGSNLLKVYEEQLDLWIISEVQKRLWLLTKENEQIVNPSEEMLDSTNDTNTRLSMIFYGEKAKNEKAKIVADVEIEAFDSYQKAKNIIEMAKARYRTFDREREYQNILTTLDSIR